ncbi:tyrosine-type recombinase/integrase [Hymenobacter baengnokdamensis]|uniref:tyrosine-type recombinase/integrase n=1 Tax=Hymenobacter baengnokdamensis TaxID=2615203 RepID=UPI00124467D3|nr:site-specific integrase [Hymenobacter baengnokdamensis]
MGYSANVVLRRPARKDGTCQVRLIVILNGRSVPVALKVAWPPALFDEEAGRCVALLPAKERGPGYGAQLEAATAAAGGRAGLAQLASDYNLIIGQAQAKANSIFVEARLSSTVLTADKFLQDYNTEGSKTDFAKYFHDKIIERHRKGKISDNTRKNHLSTWRELKRFREVIPFHTLTIDFADDFKEYLDKRIKSLNTRWGRHKDVKTYLALAKRDKIKFENPYADFTNQSGPGKWLPLSPDELRKLEAYYVLCAPGTPQRRILCKFLFSCKSGLRLGDLKNIGNAQLEGNRLTFEMQKGWSKSLQASMLPLTRQALGYLVDAQEEEGGAGFRDYADQYENRALTAIGVQLGIETKLHHHVGRETFATNFIRLGGKAEILQKLLGHKKISTTMKYVHVDDEMKSDAIASLDAMDIEKL